MNAKLLKATIDDILDPLTWIINESIAQGIFPKCLKVSLTVPIHKKSDVNEVGNYRPISLLPVFSKVFEAALKYDLMGFFETNGLLKFPTTWL